MPTLLRCHGCGEEHIPAFDHEIRQLNRPRECHWCEHPIPEVAVVITAQAGPENNYVVNHLYVHRSCFISAIQMMLAEGDQSEETLA